jgi:hypothetical protein
VPEHERDVLQCRPGALGVTVGLVRQHERVGVRLGTPVAEHGREPRHAEGCLLLEVRGHLPLALPEEGALPAAEDRDRGVVVQAAGGEAGVDQAAQELQGTKGLGAVDDEALTRLVEQPAAELPVQRPPLAPRPHAVALQGEGEPGCVRLGPLHRREEGLFTHERLQLAR